MTVRDARWLSLLAAALVAACGSPAGTTGQDGAGRSAAALASGRVLDVPTEAYPTIGSALAAARSGDTVRVAAGPYAECLTLVDGVTLTGPDVPLDEPPAVILEAQGCTVAVGADATVVHGATLRGFRIHDAQGRGIHLTGARGVVLSKIRVRWSGGMGILAERSSFSLDHSKVSVSAGAGGIVLHASDAVLVDNEIFQNASRGVVVDGGRYLNAPGFGPSRAQLVRNVIRDNGMMGLLVEDKGSSVHGIGNTFQDNALGGVLATGGGSYRGQQETFPVDANGYGIHAQGCELRCVDATCTTTTLLLDRTSVSLLDSTIEGSLGTSVGIQAVCGADLEVSRSRISGLGTGIGVGSRVFLDDGSPYTLPSTVDLRDSTAEDNANAGLWVSDGGTSARGFRNVFRGNGSGIQVTVGATYEGRQDVMASSTLGDGVFVQGCGLVCTTLDCSGKRVVQRTSRVTLEDARIEGNLAEGVNAGCGAEVTLTRTVSTGHWCGAVAVADVDLGEGFTSSRPSRILARGSTFAGNQSWGVIGYDSFLDLGTLDDPGQNSFVDNVEGAIANVSWNETPAFWNWFGTADPLAIAAMIGGYPGTVGYVPFLTSAPTGKATR